MKRNAIGSTSNRNFAGPTSSKAVDAIVSTIAPAWSMWLDIAPTVKNT
jgi:hypothetical protein